MDTCNVKIYLNKTQYSRNADYIGSYEAKLLCGRVGDIITAHKSKLYQLVTETASTDLMPLDTLSMPAILTKHVLLFLQ